MDTAYGKRLAEQMVLYEKALPSDIKASRAAVAEDKMTELQRHELDSAKLKGKFKHVVELPGREKEEWSSDTEALRGAFQQTANLNMAYGKGLAEQMVLDEKALPSDIKASR